MPEIEILINFGDSKWPFAKVVISGKGDIYIPYRISDLHESFHKSGEHHIKSNKHIINPNGNDEHTINCANPKDIYKSKKELLDDIKPFLYEPTHNGEVYVIPMPESIELKSIGNEISNKKVEIEWQKILKAVSNINGYNVKVKELQNKLRLLSSLLFSMDTILEDDLNKRVISERLKNIFKNNGFSLSDSAVITRDGEDKWVITVGEIEKFFIRKENGQLNTYAPREALIIDPIEHAICFYKKSGRIYKFKIEEACNVNRIIEKMRQTKFGNLFFNPILSALRCIEKENHNALYLRRPKNIEDLSKEFNSLF